MPGFGRNPCTTNTAPISTFTDNTVIGATHSVPAVRSTSARVTLSTSKGVKLVKRTQAAHSVVNNDKKANITTPTITTANIATTNTMDNTTAVDKVLGVLGRKLDVLFDEWLREIPQLRRSDVGRSVKVDRVMSEMKQKE